MAEMRRFALLDFLMLLLVLLVAGGTRAAYLLTCANHGSNAGPLVVQVPAPRPGPPSEKGEVLELATSVKQQGTFESKAPFADSTESTAHVAPGYPYLLGLLDMALAQAEGQAGKAAAQDKAEAEAEKASAQEKFERAARWAQMGLGTLSALLLFFFARRAFRSLAVGTLAGLLAGLNPFWVISTATLDDGTLAVFALAGCLFLAGQAGEKGGAFLSLLLGLSLAGLALVRASFLPFSFATMIWFLVRSRSLDRGWLCALVAFLGFLTGLAPWTVRNAQAFQEPVPVVTSAYLELAVGNNPTADGGPARKETWDVLQPAVEARQKTEKDRLDEMKNKGELDQARYTEQLERLNRQTARYARLGPVVVAEVQDNPEKTMKRRLDAFLGFFLGWEGLKKDEGKMAERSAVAMAEDNQAWDWLSGRYPSILLGWLLALLLLALIGWRWSYGWRWESIPASLAMFFVPLPYVLSHAESLSGPRLPLDGALMCYAAFVLAALLPGSTLLEAPNAGPPEKQEQQQAQQ